MLTGTNIIIMAAAVLFTALFTLLIVSLIAARKDRTDTLMLMEALKA